MFEEHPGRAVTFDGPRVDNVTARPAGDITRHLTAWSRGDEEALPRLVPLVYDELCRLASRYMRRERPNHTLQTEGLVHEAYLRLVDQRHSTWQNRAHFFGIAARMMRRILVDHARRHRYQKRGGGAQRLSLEQAPEPCVEPLQRFVHAE